MTVSNNEMARLAADPATPAQTLANIAYTQADLRALVAGNPASYEGLLEWLAQFHDPAIDAALASRVGGGIEQGAQNIAPERPNSPTDGDPSQASRDSVTGDEAVLKPTGALGIQKTRTIIGWSLGGLIAVGLALVLVLSNISHSPSAADSASTPDSSSATPSDTPTPTADPPTTTPSPPPPPPPVGIIALSLSRAWQRSFAAPGGYTEQITVSVGSPAKVGTDYPENVATTTCSMYSPTDPSQCQMYDTVSFPGGKTCSANASTDAVVPLYIKETSTTKGFSQSVGVNLSFWFGSSSNDAYSSMARTLSLEANYSTGLQCQASNLSSLNANSVSTKPLSEGQSSQLEGFLVISNYFTPDHPNGDPTILANIMLGIDGYSGNSGAAWTPDGNPIVFQSQGSPQTTLPAGTTLALGGN